MIPWYAAELTPQCRMFTLGLENAERRCKRLLAAHDTNLANWRGPLAQHSRAGGNPIRFSDYELVLGRDEALPLNDAANLKYANAYSDMHKNN